jgi:hypothetical protein
LLKVYREIYIGIFDKKYLFRINDNHNFGDLRKTMSRWLDLETSMMSIKFNKTIFQNDENLFNLINIGIKEYVILLRKNVLKEENYSIIGVDPRSICFSCDFFKAYLTIHNYLKLKTVKEIIIKKMNFKEVWLKFLLNEAIFPDGSIIKEIPKNNEALK